MTNPSSIKTYCNQLTVLLLVSPVTIAAWFVLELHYFNSMLKIEKYLTTLHWLRVNGWHHRPNYLITNGAECMLDISASKTQTVAYARIPALQLANDIAFRVNI